MKHALKRFLLALGLAAFGATSYAIFDPVNDDTDLFRNNPNIPSERPNVLIILDNTANWSSGGKFDAEKIALSQLVNGDGTAANTGLDSSFNVGMMIMGQGGSCRTANVDGGYLTFGIRQMTTTNKTQLAARVTAFTDGPCGGSLVGDQGSSASGGQAMHEAYLYFGGLTSRSGITQVKRDYPGNANNTYVNPSGVALGNHPHASAAATGYTSPITDGCQKNYIVFISNGPFDNGDDSPSSALYAALPGSSGAQIGLNPSGSQSNWSDEYAKYLAETGVTRVISGTTFNPKVYTYTLEVDPASTGQGPGHTALMKSMAQQGKGKYFGVTAAGSSAAILSALQSIFNEINAVNSVFAASTLPVSVNVRGTNLNQLYIGVFRPDAGDYPRWLGNLKAYQLKRDPSTGLVSTVDSNGTTAINSTTGFITSSAKSFWTDGTSPTSTYWNFRASTENGDGGSADSPDGDLVEKGGAAQKVRALYYSGGVNGSPTRPVYTCTSGATFGTACTAGSLLSATPFSVANTDIDQNELNITSRTVNTLTAAVSKPITSLIDRRDVTLDNADTSSFVTISTITTPTVTLSPAVTALNNSKTVNITAVTNNAAQKTASLTKIGTGPSAKSQATVTGGHGLQDGQTVNISGGSCSAAFLNTVAITYVSSTVFTYTLGSGNSSDATCTLTTSDTYTTVTATGHGFTSGQSVTINNVSPTATFSGTGKVVTVVDADTFTYPSAVSTGPTIAGATAVGASTSVVASATGHGLAVGRIFTISGATPTSYNGTYTITAATANTFTYQTATAISTAATGPFVTTYGGTTATATVPLGHPFVNGQTVNISGALPAGFSGSVSPNVIFNKTATTFDYLVAPGLGAATANPTIKASGGTTNIVTATLTNHNFAVGNNVSIRCVNSPHNVDTTVTQVVDANTFKYDAGTTAAIVLSSGCTTPYVRLTSNPLAYATIANHGYGTNPGDTFTVTISGAVGPSPSFGTGYNKTNVTGTRVDANTFSYVLSGSQGGLASAPGSASTNTTTAVASVTAHGFANGEQVTISGATVAAFNGTKTITFLTSDSFSYPLSSAQGLAVASATPPGITAAGQGERTSLINWIRGEDNYQDENSNSSFTDVRWSLHGDVLHSRPAVVNYNRLVDCSTTDCRNNVDNDVYIFYGGNDGLFRAVKGGFGKTSTAVAPGTDTTPGTEAWAFVARENFSNLRRLRINAPQISNALKKPYFFDGPIGVYSKDANGDGKILVTGTPDPTSATQDQVWLFLTMRRGGRFIYALDVSQPLYPRLLWRKGCPSLETDPSLKEANGCDLGFGELGYTFSEPKVTFLDSTITSDPVIMFGAGYDPLVDDQTPTTINCIVGGTSGYVRTGGTMGNCSTGTQVSRSMGRGLYVVNARTGALLFAASSQSRPTSIPAANYLQVTDMDYSISTDFAVVVGDPTARPFRAYFGDNGGQMWRFDFGDASRANWKLTKIGSIADNSTTTTFADAFSASNITALRGARKFQFAVDVVGGTGYDVVVAGSGDREHPFDTSVINRVYGFKDTSQTSTPPAGWVPITHSLSTVTYNGISGIKPLQDVSSQCIEVPGNCSASKGAEQVSGGTVTQTAPQNTAGAVGATTNRGWFITLADGEKQIGSTLAAGSGSILFATNQPSTSAGGSACSPNLGVARQYAVNYLDGSAFNGTTLSTSYAGGGFLPSPVLVYVGLGGATGTGSSTGGTGVSVGGNVSGGTIGIGAGGSTGGAGNTATAVVCYGASCSLAPGTVLFSRVRKFWYKEID